MEIESSSPMKNFFLKISLQLKLISQLISQNAISISMNAMTLSNSCTTPSMIPLGPR